jgi:C4-dicarboxylate-specific signal transduction histidine kinase
MSTMDPRQIQQVLEHFSRLAALGEVIDSALHELRNVESIIGLMGSLLQELAAEEKPIGLDDARDLIHATRMLREVTTSLAVLSRPGDATVQAVDATEAVEACIANLKSSGKTKVLTVTFLPPQARCLVQVGPKLLEQTMICLVGTLASMALAAPRRLPIELTLTPIGRMLRLRGSTAMDPAASFGSEDPRLMPIQCMARAMGGVVEASVEGTSAVAELFLPLGLEAEERETLGEVAATVG